MSLGPDSTPSGIEPPFEISRPDWAEFAETCATKKSEGARAHWAVMAVEAFNSSISVGTEVDLLSPSVSDTCSWGCTTGFAYLQGSTPVVDITHPRGEGCAFAVDLRRVALRVDAHAGALAQVVDIGQEESAPLDKIATAMAEANEARTEERVPCGHGCIFGRPKGMATNGGCHCLDDVSRPLRIALRREVTILRQREAAARTETEELRARMIRQQIKVEALEGQLRELLGLLGVATVAEARRKLRDGGAG